MAGQSLLTKTTIASCPVSRPNVISSPSEYYIPTTSGYQNSDGTLFTIPWPEGTVIFAREGPGFIGSDGSLSMKWPWWREVSGKLTIEGRRLDTPAPPLRAEIPDGYGEIGFQPSTIIFSQEGCWEITGTVGHAQLTFVTLVVKVPFKFMGLNWVPKEIASTKYDTSNLPESLREIQSYSNGGELVMESAVDEQAMIPSNPNATQQKVTVWGQTGICVEGALINQQWQDNVDAGFLQWTADGSSYRISHRGLGLRCEDLLSMVDTS